MGFLTLDIANIVNATSAAGNCIGMENTGTICICTALADYIYKTFEFRKSLKEVQRIVENDGIFKHRGREIDISDKVAECSKRYLVDVLNFIEDKFGTAIDNLK